MFIIPYKDAAKAGQSDNVDAHTKTESLKVHYADIDAANNFTRPDEWIDLTDEPDHNELCKREQIFFLNAIKNDSDLTDHVEDAVNSLRIAFACDESVRTGEVVRL